MAPDLSKKPLSAPITEDNNLADVATTLTVVAQHVVEQDLATERESDRKDTEEEKDRTAIIRQPENNHREYEERDTDNIFESMENQDVAIRSASIDLVELERGLDKGPYYGYNHERKEEIATEEQGEGGGVAATVVDVYREEIGYACQQDNPH
jgi:hypothetical protein